MLAWIGSAVLAFVLLSLGAVLALRYVAPISSSFMIREGTAAWFDADPRPWQLRYQWRSVRDISPQLAIAVVASEDQRFPIHRGFDVRAIRKALAEAEDGGRVRGASTISQQVAKNLFLWSGRSFVRKGLEAWFTVLIEWLWPKQRILEVYLNIAQFGRGIYGAQAASSVFFQKDARALDAGDAALLAAVLPNPVRLRADRPSDYVQRRQHEIQEQVRTLGGPAWLRGAWVSSASQAPRPAARE